MIPRPLRRIGGWAAPVVLVATALGLAACGGGDGGGETAPRGTVEDQLGFDQSGIMERQSRVEAAIRDCMKAQGFEYVPVDPLAQRAAVTGSARLSDEDFLNQFGYGISTLYGRGGAQADPNERIRSALGAADRAAYDRALGGENAGVTFAQAVDTGDFTRLGGCTKQATESVFGGAQVLTTLQGKLDELDERILEDQRMVRAIEQWSACMTKAGYRYGDPEEIDLDVTKRFQAIVGASVEPGATAAPAGATYNQTALTALQRQEVAIAVADLSCEKQFITPVEEVVRPQYEAAFRRQNQRLITRVRPASG
jgi:hypothetical protein